MRVLGSFVIGFIGGWAARSSVDTSHGLLVKVVGVMYGTRARLHRWAAVERERISDLVAEVRSRYDREEAGAADESRAG